MSLSCTEVRRIVEGSARQTPTGIQRTDIYRVKYNGFATPVAALTASDGTRSVPAMFSTDVDGSTIYVIDKSATRLKDSPLFFDVEVVNGTLPGGTVETPPESPTAKWDVSISVAGIENEETVDRTRDGLPVLTSAGEPYPLALTKVFYDEVITVKFKTRTVDVEDLGDARGRVNSDTVSLNIEDLNYSRTFPPDTLKLGNVTYDVGVDVNGEFYWDVSVPLIYRTNVVDGEEVGWARTVVDQGFYYLDGTDYVRILDDQGLPTKTASYLDGAGAVLAGGSDAVLLVFPLEDQAVFASLLSGIS